MINNSHCFGSKRWEESRNFVISMLSISRAERVRTAVSLRALTSTYLKILLLYSRGMAGWEHSGKNPKLQISSVFPYQWPWMSQTSHRFASSFCQRHPSVLVLSCQSWDKENHRDYIKTETWQVREMQQKTSETTHGCKWNTSSISICAIVQLLPPQRLAAVPCASAGVLG